MPKLNFSLFSRFIVKDDTPQNPSQIIDTTLEQNELEEEIEVQNEKEDAVIEDIEQLISLDQAKKSTLIEDLSQIVESLSLDSWAQQTLKG